MSCESPEKKQENLKNQFCIEVDPVKSPSKLDYYF